MNVLYGVNSSFVGGAERSLERIVHGFACGKGRKKVKSIVASCRRGALEELAKGWECDVIRVQRGMPRGKMDPAFWWSCIKIAMAIKRGGVDIVHANDVTSCPVLSFASRIARRPLVTHVRYTYDSEFMRWLTKFGVDGFIFASKFMQGWYDETLGAQQRTWVVYNGFAPPAAVGERTVSWLRHSLFGGEQGDLKLVGFFGQVVEVKGVEEFILMISRVVREYGKGVRFIIVGDDLQSGRYNFRRRMEDLVRKEGVAEYCKFLGFREDVWELLHVVDVVVIPSRVEPLGNVAIESAAAGRPVVASRVGGLQEIVRNGETGILVDPGAVSAFAESVVGLLKNQEKCKEMGRRGVELVQKEFSLDCQLDALIDIYEALCNNEKG